MSKLQMITRVPEEEQHQADVESVIVKGDKVFSCADDGKVKVFDTNLKLLKEFKAHDSAVYDLMVVGENLFTCGVDTTIKIFDLNTFELKTTIEKHEASVKKFCTDGNLIFAGDEKGEVRGYTPEGELSVLYNVVEEVWGLCAQGDLLYSVRDRGVTISQVRRGEDNKYFHVKSLDGRAPIYAHGDEWLVFADSSGLNLQVCDNQKSSSFAKKGCLKGHEMIITCLGGCGTQVLSGGYGPELILWDLTKMSETGRCTLPDVPNGIAVNDQGDVFVVGSGGFICKLKASL